MTRDVLALIRLYGGRGKVHCVNLRKKQVFIALECGKFGMKNDASYK